MSKELEALESIIETFYDKDSEDIQIVRKALEAIEILKNKNIDLFYLQASTELERYNDACDYFRSLSYLTQEEYDLLKEVLK